MYSEYKLNKPSDHIQPCLTPFPVLNHSVVPCLALTVASWPSYRFLRRQIRWSGIPVSENFPQFAVIYTVKGFNVVSEVEIDFFFLEFPCISYDPRDIGNMIPGSSSFSKSSLYIWKFPVNVPLKASVIYFSCWTAFHGIVVPPFGLLFSKTCQIFLFCCSGTLMICLPLQAWFPCFFLYNFIEGGCAQLHH